MSEKLRLPDSHDWVTDRANCSIELMFHVLRDMAEANVKTRKGLSVRPNLDIVFREHGNLFIVLSSSFELDQMKVVVALRDDHIDIEDEGRQLKLKATVTLDDDCQCRFQIGDKQYAPWQVLKMALEPVLFRTDSN